MPDAEKDAPVDQMGDPYSDRSAVLCRTCMRPLTWETRVEPGFLPRTGWYDDARSDPLICFKAADYRHVPLTAREWAYYEAGQASVTPPAEPRCNPVGGVHALWCPDRVTPPGEGREVKP